MSLEPDKGSLAFISLWIASPKCQGEKEPCGTVLLISMVNGLPCTACPGTSCIV